MGVARGHVQEPKTKPSNMPPPRLLGIENSNRDFSSAEAWGKNIFNSAFPVALCNYLQQKNLPAKYLDYTPDGFKNGEIDIDDVYRGYSPEEIYFHFETDYSPHSQTLLQGEPLSIDLVMKDNETHEHIHPLEVKLTTLPDNSTADKPDNEQSTELVIRTPTIGSIACNIVCHSSNVLRTIFSNHAINDLSPNALENQRVEIKRVLQQVLDRCAVNSSPILLQPVWKTIGKSSILAENCLDVFIWSDLGMLHFILSQMKTEGRISRQTRTAIWIFVMLNEYCSRGEMSLASTIERYTYGTKNDKAFSSTDTHRFMYCDELTTPRIMKDEIRNIILDGGHLLLSPERRFDGIIQSNAGELFN